MKENWWFWRDGRSLNIFFFISSSDLEYSRHLHARFLFLFQFKWYILCGRAIACIRRRQWQPTPVLSPGKFHGRRSLVGCSPWGCYESDTTELLLFHFSLSCIGEGNGNPLQCSCLEHPRDGGAWWAAVYGVSQSRTRLSSSSIAFITLDNCI